jgi:hypothetical protein
VAITCRSTPISCSSAAPSRACAWRICAAGSRPGTAGSWPAPGLRRGVGLDRHDLVIFGKLQRVDVVVVIARGEQRELGQARCAGRLGIEAGGLALFLRGLEIGIVGQRDLHRIVGRGGQAGQRRRRFQIGRHLAHHLDVGFAAGNEIGLGLPQLPARQREARVRLRHVGPRHVADLEAVARRLQVHFQNLHVAAVEADDRLIADHVHIGGHGLAEDARSVPRRLAWPASTRVSAAWTELRTDPPE